MSVIDLAGIHEMAESDYLADPVPVGSLSASGAKLIIECPAKFEHRQQAGEKHSDVFDFGKAAHAEVLGVGNVEVLDYPDWRTKEAKAAKADAYDRGVTPLLAHDHRIVKAMADEIRHHPIAAALLDPERGGAAEQTLIWRDLIWRRARLDWLPAVPDTGRMIVPDYKTAPDASRSGFTNASARYGYMMQAAWYLDGVRTLLGVEDPAFVFIVQEKDPPYVINVVEMTESYRRIGEWRNEYAVDIYQRCMDTGHWPAYADGVMQISAPRWLEIEHEEQIEQLNEGVTI